MASGMPNEPEWTDEQEIRALEEAKLDLRRKISDDVDCRDRLQFIAKVQGWLGDMRADYVRRVGWVRKTK